ncbi:MAG: DJ-1/PfpI family protein [Bacteroidales bacterium]|jgi:4-methyl-5(b-hydroxyethyl)-thiazole monophosphate biosynthesis|nr:DJ-1/PfpI family protein [Bacteroidales bacterium]
MQAFIFLAPGFEEIEAITVIDVLRRAGIEVVTVSIPDEDDDEFWVEGAHGISVFSDIDFEYANFKEGDILILPGGQPGTNNLNAHNGLKRIVQEYYDQKKCIAAICAAPLVLGEMGLLKGKKATCYPGYESQLIGAEYIKDQTIVVDGDIITANGPGAALEFALAVVAKVKDTETAQTLASQMMVRK